MKNAIEVKNLTKHYKTFSMESVSFSIPEGLVCGFIGQNGAGKTTTLRLILGMAHREGGEIAVLGRDAGDVSVKDDLGVLFEIPYFQDNWTPTDVEKALRPFYSRWDAAAYDRYLTLFSLDRRQKFKTLSRGMKMKLGIACALSHDAKLLLLDEPTSGLDPVVRDEILDLLREYVSQEGRTVFFSTHITSDLEKIADHITYIHRGKIEYCGGRDELIERYCAVRGGRDDLKKISRGRILGLREHIGGFEGMMSVNDLSGLPSGVITEPVNLEDIMVFIGRQEANA
ncbi:MAG: ABC transporter ATP-binding protein [Oscillospiraceae bacterium]|nr:ABC transporter ATP-binding protein [Oscillospiraceae bacterium]